MVDYDRELIAEMLETIQMTKFRQADITEQARLLREADNADAAGVHTAAQPPAVGVNVSDELEWLRLVLLREPVRREKMGGQTHSYFDAAEVLGWVEEAQKHAALRTGGGA